MQLWARAAIASLLLVVLCGTLVHFDVTEDTHDPYVDNERLVTDYDAHVGERTLLFGTVQSVAADRLRIEVQSDEGAFEMAVPEPGVSVQRGGVVQVYGTLEDGNVIEPRRVVVVNSDGGSDLYKYAVSAVGALLVAGLFARYWTIDTDQWALEER